MSQKCPNFKKYCGLLPFSATNIEEMFMCSKVTQRLIDSSSLFRYKTTSLFAFTVLPNRSGPFRESPAFKRLSLGIGIDSP